MKLIDAEKIGLTDIEIIMCDGDYKTALGMLIEKIANAPAAPTIEPKRGKWIWDDEGYHCSECFYHAYGETGSILSNEWHFCPNCGAKMESE